MHSACRQPGRLAGDIPVQYVLHHSRHFGHSLGATPSVHIGCGATVGCDCAQYRGRLSVRLGQLLHLGSCGPNEQPAAAGAAARSLWRILGLPPLLHGACSSRPMHTVPHTENVSCNGQGISMPQCLVGPVLQEPLHLCSSWQRRLPAAGCANAALSEYLWSCTLFSLAILTSTCISHIRPSVPLSRLKVQLYKRRRARTCGLPQGPAGFQESVSDCRHLIFQTLCRLACFP